MLRLMMKKHTMTKTQLISTSIIPRLWLFLTPTAMAAPQLLFSNLNRLLLLKVGI